MELWRGEPTVSSYKGGSYFGPMNTPSLTWRSATRPHRDKGGKGGKSHYRPKAGVEVGGKR